MNRLLELITNDDGRLSTSNTLLVAAFIATTLVLIIRALFYDFNEWEFGLYLSAWVIQNQATKRAYRHNYSQQNDDRWRYHRDRNDN